MKKAYKYKSKPKNKADLASERDARGRFLPGHGGRPPGSRNRCTVIAEQLTLNDAEALLKKAISLARAGNESMLKFLLSRLLPRSLPIEADLGGKVGLAAIDKVVALVCNGEITPADGLVLSQILVRRQDLLVVDQLEARVAALENATGLHFELNTKRAI